LACAEGLKLGLQEPRRKMMNTSQMLRFLVRKGCVVLRPAKGSHLLIQRGDKVTTLPWRSGQKQLSHGVMASLRKDLGIEE
jgi:predicted RNA binding protein YcfA (HicA-like mRNA interferase family)